MIDSMEKLVSLAKRRGFIYPGSDLYGGLANTYDYGPVGAELLRNIKNLWWEYFVHRRDDMVGIDASLISHEKVWEASGHTSGFSDLLIDCRNCKHRMRADHLIENFLEDNDLSLSESSFGENLDESSSKFVGKQKVEGLPSKYLDQVIQNHKINCPNCKKLDWTESRKFNLLFPIRLGIVESEQDTAYLRGETAQGMFINFDNVINSTRLKLPFGLAQLGKSFRNEVTLGNSVFRTLEFEQGEIEYFFDSEKSNWEEIFERFKENMQDFVLEELKVKKENIRFRVHSDEERSFYSQRTEDLEYNFPFGFKEVWGLAYRTDYDLAQHIKYSGKNIFILDPVTNKKILPHVIEPAVGINRLFLMVLCDAYREEDGRVFLSISPKIAPYKAAVFPLLANKPELVDKARHIYKILKERIYCSFDDRGNIGKRYLYQDEIGTPWCVTVDFDTLENNSVTVRDRDTAQQIRVGVDELTEFFMKKLS